MADIFDSVERAAGRLYTAFIMRDLTFFISGAIVIVVVAPSALERLTDFLSLSPKFHWFSILAFLAISYVLGIILQEAVRTFMEPLSREYIKRRVKNAESKEELVVRLEKIIKDGCSDHTIRGIERILFLKQVGGTLFSALLTILVVFVVRCRINRELFCSVVGYTWTNLSSKRKYSQALKPVVMMKTMHRSNPRCI